MRKIAIAAAALWIIIILADPLLSDTDQIITGNVKRYTIKIIREIPHRTESFTQGLLFYEEKIYESTGLIGDSTLQRIDPHTGVVEKILHVPGVFAEGLARWNQHLIQLTWHDGIAFVYNISDFSKVGSFSYETEGWGLTSDNRHLIMSDGSDKLYFRNPHSFNVERTVRVMYKGKPLHFINELEYAEGLIYANVWQKKMIVQIDPVKGWVVGLVDCQPLFDRLPPLDFGNVLNGIAYNNNTKSFYLTGKNWPKIFEVALVPFKL